MRLTEVDEEKILYMRRNGLGYRNVAKVIEIGADTIKSFICWRDLGGVLVDKERHLDNFAPICKMFEHTPTKHRKLYCNNKYRLTAWKRYLSCL